MANVDRLLAHLNREATSRGLKPERVERLGKSITDKLAAAVSQPVTPPAGGKK